MYFLLSFPLLCMYIITKQMYSTFLKRELNGMFLLLLLVQLPRSLVDIWMEFLTEQN